MSEKPNSPYASFYLCLHCASECGSEESVWICAGCGAATCGRYVKAHGLRHFEKVRQKHPVCMDARETAVFW